MGNLSDKLYNSIRKVIVKGAYELSYLTGFGWEYGKGDVHRDFRSRKYQRYNLKSDGLLSKGFDDSFL